MHELRTVGFRGIVLAMFVDDSGIGVFDHMDFVTMVQNDLAAMLGLVYKFSKDELGVSHMKLIGFEVSCSSCDVRVKVPDAYV